MSAAASKRLFKPPVNRLTGVQTLTLSDRPELRLDLHVYDADPAKRFVFVNMRKLREGDSLPEGVRLDVITQTGARFSFRGTQFTLDAN